MQHYKDCVLKKLILCYAELIFSSTVSIRVEVLLPDMVYIYRFIEEVSSKTSNAFL